MARRSGAQAFGSESALTRIFSTRLKLFRCAKGKTLSLVKSKGLGISEKLEVQATNSLHQQHAIPIIGDDNVGA